MFHMLSCFDLKPGDTIEDFKPSLEEFDRYFRTIDLIHSTGPIGRRQRHPVMDTDDERDHEYFFVTTFRDRKQCDRSVEHIYAAEEPGKSIHAGIWHKVTHPVFTCWEDL